MAAVSDVGSLERVARRRLPRFAYDFIAGGAGDERALRRARERMQEVCLLPRILTGCESRSTSCRVLGQTYAAPFAVAPTGLTNLAWPGADVGLAQAAKRFGIPYVISTPATTALERLASEAGSMAWFQLYMGRDQHIGLDLIERARGCGIDTLVVTADVPVPGKRRRDLRNRLGVPLRMTPARVADLLLHPAWSLATLRAGLPRFANLERYASANQGVQSLATLMASQNSARFDWAGLDSIRERWAGKLVLKGVLHPADAEAAVRVGVDAVVVSNHGGRQLDSAPAPIEMLRPIADAVGGRSEILFDGGVRCGEDIARAVALGASLVLIGRPFLWAAAALGPAAGGDALIDMLHREFDAAMGQLGCRTVPDVSRADVYAGPNSCHALSWPHSTASEITVHA